MPRPANESVLPFPPYGSFVSFLNDLNAMEVLPNQLNQQVFAASYSGSARQQILRAFRFFDLMSENNAPNEERLKPLMNPDSRSAAMGQLLTEYYKELIGLPLETAGPAEVNGWFANVGMDPATTRKAKSFFLTAAKENGIKMHSLVMDRSVRRVSVSRARKRATVKKREEIGTNNGVTQQQQQPQVQTQILFHPAVDAFLREARKLTEGDSWTQTARDNVVAGFTTQLDLFLPVKK